MTKKKYKKIFCCYFIYFFTIVLSIFIYSCESVSNIFKENAEVNYKVEVGTTSIFISLVLLGYTFLLNHFLVDLDNFSTIIDDCRIFIKNHKKNNNNTLKHITKFSRVYKNIFAVCFGVLGIFLLIIYFLILLTVLIFISEDSHFFWWITTPIVIILIYFWGKYVRYINSIYNKKYKNCCEIIESFFKNDIKKNIMDSMNQLRIDYRAKKEPKDFFYIGNIKGIDL